MCILTANSAPTADQGDAKILKIMIKPANAQLRSREKSGRQFHSIAVSRDSKPLKHQIRGRSEENQSSIIIKISKDPPKHTKHSRPKKYMLKFSQAKNDLPIFFARAKYNGSFKDHPVQTLPPEKA